MNYSIAGRKAIIGKNAGKTLYSASLQLDEPVTLDQFAEHMSSHDCKYNKGDIYSVLIQATKCVREFLLEGRKVQFGDLGTFVPKIKSASTLSSEDFTAQNITVVTARWQVGASIKNMRKDATLNYQPSRKNQALLRQAEKSGQSNMTLAEKTNAGTGTTGDNTGGNTGNPGAGGE